MQKIKFKRIKLTFLLGVFFIVPTFAKAGVVFETTFDSNADWNTSGSLNKDCGLLSCSDAPTNWNNYYSLPPVGSLAVTIKPLPSSLADHTGGTAKKAFVAYYNNVSYSGGQELSKTFSQDYDELYVRAWIRTQPGWSTAENSSIKLWRIGHWDREGSAFAYFPAGNGCPIGGINWATNSQYRGTQGGYTSWARFDPQQSAYYPPDGTPLADDLRLPLVAGVSPTGTGGFADGAWHRYDIHVKMNTQSGSTWNSNGVWQLWYDGNLKDDFSNIPWRQSGSSTSVGWNSIQFGGNSDNPYTGGSNPQWVAFDDIVVSTTSIPANYVIGGGSADTIAPSAPSGLSVL